MAIIDKERQRTLFIIIVYSFQDHVRILHQEIKPLVNFEKE